MQLMPKGYAVPGCADSNIGVGYGGDSWISGIDLKRKQYLTKCLCPLKDYHLKHFKPAWNISSV